MDEDGKVGHRGFNQKAREVLLGEDDHFRGMSKKANSDYDIFRRYKLSKKASNNSSPKSQSSTTSIPEQPTFDTIGEAPKVKHHMKLSDIGKARSCADLKSDKRLLRTYQEENIIKMPSIDSDIGSNIPVQPDDLATAFETMGKCFVYAVNDNKDKKRK